MGGDTNHDNHSGCDLALSSAWGAADLALQSWLGILSQQWFGSRCSGPRDPVAPRALIRVVALTLLGRLNFTRAVNPEGSDVEFLDQTVSWTAG